MNPDSTDDERATSDASILVYDSQTVVPETQLEHGLTEGLGGDADPDHDEPLTPTSAAIMDKLAIKKAPANSEPPPIVFKPLWIPNFNTEPEVRFNFTSQARKATEDAPPKIQSPSFQPIMNDPAVGILNHAAGNVSSSK